MITSGTSVVMLVWKENIFHTSAKIEYFSHLFSTLRKYFIFKNILIWKLVIIRKYFCETNQNIYPRLRGHNFFDRSFNLLQ